MKKKCILLYSGGCDSTTLLYWLKNKNYDVYTLSFLYGQKHGRIELECAKYHIKKLNINHKIIDITFMKDLIGDSSSLISDNVSIPDVKKILGHPQPSTYVPFRNLIFLSIALSYAESIGAKEVYYAAQRADIYGYWDVTEEFVERVNKLSQLNRMHQIQIKTPFVNMKKSEIVKVGLELNIDYSKTWSDYNIKKDGVISATQSERIKAMKENGIIDELIIQGGMI